MEKNNGKTIALIALFVAVIGLSIGFAALNTTLTIDGSAEVQTANWLVKFQNLNTNPTVVGKPVVTNPDGGVTALLNDTTFGNFDIAFKQPGDSVTYEFEIANAGSIDAELENFAKETLSCTPENATVCGEITYEFVYAEDYEYSDTVTYSQGTAVTQGNLLAAGTSAKVKLTVGFDVDKSLEDSELPTENVAVDGFKITLTYGQA